MNEDIKREIIMDHYSNPIHKKIPQNKDKFIKVNTNNSSCIDNLDIYVSVNNNKIDDIYFVGEACAISTSSCSIMIQNLIGKNIEDAIYYVEQFKNMINEQPYDKEVLKDANCYDTIYKQNNRKHCAYLPYEGILKVLNQYKSEE